MALVDQFETSARRRPDGTALVDARGRLTYAQLLDQVARFLAMLEALGVAPGDRIVMQVTNSREAAVTVWAVLRLGAVLVPLHSISRAEGSLAVVRDCNPRWAIIGSEQYAGLDALTSGAESLRGVAVWSSGRPGPWDNDARCVTCALAVEASTVVDALRASKLADESLAAILYTSGSTGEPKGVMLTHGNMAAAVSAVNAYLGLGDSDVLYSALPLSSSYGLYQLILGLAVGATVVLDRSFAFPAKSLELMAAERATVFAGVPTMYAWLAHSTILERYDLGSLRIMTSAAAALPLAHARRVRERLPQARLFVMYGQTECKRISYLEPDDFDRRPGSVGRGLSRQELAVVDDNGFRVGPGETGELVVAGPHVMQGYWGKPEETARKLRPIQGDDRPWLHTDDLFRMDVEGYLYFIGRRDDVFKVGGHKVSPAEVEETLVRMPGVVEAAVTGVPDAEWGQVVKAFVVTGEEAAPTAEDVIRFCAQRLRGFMVPKSVTFVKQLPKTESGKVRRRDLG